MGVSARDLMETEFFTIHPETTISEAAMVFKEASEKRKQKLSGLVVTDDHGRLVGVLSLYDFLCILRPKQIHVWGEMTDLDMTEFLDGASRRAKSIQVGDIMTTDVISVGPETHLLMIMDLMIKKHVRRLPVVENGKVIGIVYASTVFYQLVERLLD